MNDSNNVVVKVKYEGLNPQVKTNSRPDRVTEWYIGRIITAIVIILLLIGGLIYFIINNNSKPSTGIVEPDLKPIVKVLPEVKQESINEVTKVIEKKPINKVTKVKETSDKKPQLNALELSSNNNIKKQDKIINKIPDVILHKNVSRALLVGQINNKEPGKEIVSPIVANKDKAIGVFYFTEINNMKGKTLFHQWERDGKLIYEKKIHILGNRWRASTSKLITYSKTGSWRVRLVNKQGDVFNELKFEVVK